MLKKLFRVKLVILRFFVVFCCFFLFFGGANLIFASETSGTIDGINKYAWGENIGWLNFACSGCNVSVNDSYISGYTWSKQYGWVNLAPSNSGVKNNGEGVLSGFAWSSNLGWINFDGVIINSVGDFSGYATIKSDNSKINFNCAGVVDSCSSANFKVKTDWRPASMRSTGGSSGSKPRPPTLPPIPPLIPPSVPLPVLPPITVTPVVSVTDKIPEVASSFLVSTLDSFLNFFKPIEIAIQKNILVQAPRIVLDSILNFFKQGKGIIETNILVQIPRIAPLSFNTQWNLLPVEAIRKFVFAPLPYEVRILATKFPELDRTLKSVGVERLTDMSKLSGVTLNLPGLTELTNTLKNIGAERLADMDKLTNVNLYIPGLSDLEEKMMTNLGIGVGSGKIALMKGLPLAKFSLSEKKNLPSEFVFARASGELVDLNVAMSIGDKGEIIQKISSLPGKVLKLVVKPISKVRSVTGYFVFKAATPRVMENQISRSSLTASALFSMNDLVEKNAETLPMQEGIPVENRLVLSSFEYTDSDSDGIYTADVASPMVPGEYEIITVIDYIDPVLGTRQMRMITVVDPEGYLFEKNNGKETRIPSAIVSLYWLNNVTKKYELWPAKDYQQENPQITDIRGTYSFLVPEGSYYFFVEAPGYNTYQGKVFVVVEGSGVHQNIELKSSQGLFSNFDWETILLIVVFLLLVYNLLQGRLLRIFKRT